MSTMTLKDFKVVRNRQRPAVCYSYEKKTECRSYSIFTMDGGFTFLASIEEIRLDGKYYSEFSETYFTTDGCLRAFNDYIHHNPE